MEGEVFKHRGRFLYEQAQLLGFKHAPKSVIEILLRDYADDLTVEQVARLMRVGEMNKKKKVVRKREKPRRVVEYAKPTKKQKIVVIDLTGDDDGEEAEFVVLGDDDDSLRDAEREYEALLEECLQGFDDAYVDSVVPKEDFVVFDNHFHCQELALGAAAF